MVILVLKNVGVIFILCSLINLFVLNLVFFFNLWLVVFRVFLLGLISFFGNFNWYEWVFVVYFWISIKVFLFIIGIIIMVLWLFLVICLNWWVVLFENFKLRCFIWKSLFWVMIFWWWICGNGLFGLIFCMFFVIILLLYLLYLVYFIIRKIVCFFCFGMKLIWCCWIWMVFCWIFIMIISFGFIIYLNG